MAKKAVPDLVVNNVMDTPFEVHGVDIVGGVDGTTPETNTELKEAVNEVVATEEIAVVEAPVEVPVVENVVPQTNTEEIVMINGFPNGLYPRIR